MSNKSIALKFFELYGKQHDPEACAPLFAPDASIVTPVAPGALDFPAYKQVGYAFLNAFSNLDVEVLAQVEEGNQVVTRAVWSGAQSGPLNGMPSNGGAFRTESVFIDTFENGQIVDRVEVGNLLSMMQQLGYIPAAATA